MVCNADEGDSGTFADRLLMECDPYQLLEAMAIAGVAVGATRGFIYLRSEYPKAHAILQEAISIARGVGWLGESVLGSGHAFDVELRLGAGSYICGEETAMLESIEGKRGVVRAKPPLPALSGSQRAHACGGHIDTVTRRQPLRDAWSGAIKRHHAFPTWR